MKEEKSILENIYFVLACFNTCTAKSASKRQGNKNYIIFVEIIVRYNLTSLKLLYF